jgi:uronate dehydrogenase
LKKLTRCLRVSDIAALAPAASGEEVVVAALQDPAAVDAMVAGVQAIVHLGGISTDAPFAPILEANIVGVWNLYEAARRHGVGRVVFASSNHVTGFYRQDEVVSPSDPLRPDGHYGLSKAFGENVARFYFDRYGIESVCLRIGSSFPEPRDRRMLATWLSYDDLERLVVAGLTAPVVGCSVVYGVSANTATWWDNTSASHLGFRPQDSSERFRAAAEARQPSLDASDPATLFQGGAFVKQGPFER